MYKSRQYCLSRHFFVAVSLFFSIALSTSQATFAQNFTDDDLIVVEIDGLTPYIYGDIAKAFEQNTNVEIVRACVPANVLLIKRNNSNLDFAQLRALITSAAPNAGNVSATELNANGFDERCMNARMGRGQ